VPQANIPLSLVEPAPSLARTFAVKPRCGLLSATKKENTGTHAVFWSKDIARVLRRAATGEHKTTQSVHS